MRTRSGERRKAKAWESGDALRIKCIALLTAVTGLREESGINERGRRTTRSRNWIVLLQRIVTKRPQGKNVKSESKRCWEGSKERPDLTRRWLFIIRSIPKNDTKHIAQKEASKLERMLRCE